MIHSVLLQAIKSTKNLFGAATRLTSLVNITLGVYAAKNTLPLLLACATRWVRAMACRPSLATATHDGNYSAAPRSFYMARTGGPGSGLAAAWDTINA